MPKHSTYLSYIPVNKTIVFIGLVIIAIVGYVAIGPFVTIHEIRVGIEEQDSEKLAANIDFPALRQNLKEQFNAYIMKQAATELKDNPFGALGMAIGEKIADGMVDASVTPSSLSNLAAGKQPQRVNDSSRSSGHGHGIELFKNARYSYDGPSRFSARITAESGGEIRFVFTRDGLSWKLSNIVVPIGAESSAGLDATASTVSGGTTPSVTSPNSLKIETIDTRATETNDVWARFAWKLTVTNSGGEPIQFSVRIEWQDRDGFIIDEDEAYHLSLDAHQTHTFTGDKLISYPAAARVSKIQAKVRP